MISKEDKIKIQDIANRYNVKKVILFGSGCDPSKASNDIDLAVEGVSDSDFFRFYSELLFNLSKSVDIVDLSKKNRFNEIVMSEGLLLYG